MATTSDFRKGLCIEHDNDIYRIVDFQHVKPARGNAFVRTKLKSVISGKHINKTFAAGVKIKLARIEARPYQFLYSDGIGFHFMHTETYEQITLNKDIIDIPELLKDGQKVNIIFHDETNTPISCELPAFVIMEITYTEPGVKGDTSAGTAMKPAETETGLKIKVPLFVEKGDKIKIDTRTLQYTERVKNT